MISVFRENNLKRYAVANLNYFAVINIQFLAATAGST